MIGEVIAAGGFAGLILAYVWWDCRRAERRWLKPREPWTGSCLRDRDRDRAFPKRRSWDKSK